MTLPSRKSPISLERIPHSCLSRGLSSAVRLSCRRVSLQLESRATSKVRSIQLIHSFYQTGLGGKLMHISGQISSFPMKTSRLLTSLTVVNGTTSPSAGVRIFLEKLETQKRRGAQKSLLRSKEQRHKCLLCHS